MERRTQIYPLSLRRPHGGRLEGRGHWPGLILRDARSALLRMRAHSGAGFLTARTTRRTDAYP
jgi:hypothetical protein